MAAPFGISIGDFLVVGKVVSQIATELRKVCMFRSSLISYSAQVRTPIAVWEMLTMFFHRTVKQPPNIN